MMKKIPFVGIIPYDLRKTKNIAEIPLKRLISNNKNAKKADEKIKNLTEFEHIIIYPASNIWFKNYRKLNCKVSLMIAEPKAIHRRYYLLIWFLRRKFYKIFTRDKALNKKYDNVLIIPIVECWISPLSNQDFLKKDKLISLIASGRNTLVGHRLRHQIIKTLDCSNIDILGRGYAPFNDKKDGLLSYNFSIVIENCQEIDYFSEKIVDCFACKTVPIYWGCPNIGDYFNLDGIIIFQTIDELQQILTNLTDDSYQQLQKPLEENCNTARKLSNTYQLITNKLIQEK